MASWESWDHLFRNQQVLQNTLNSYLCTYYGKSTKVWKYFNRLASSKSRLSIAQKVNISALFQSAEERQSRISQDSYHNLSRPKNCERKNIIPIQTEGISRDMEQIFNLLILFRGIWPQALYGGSSREEGKGAKLANIERRGGWEIGEQYRKYGWHIRVSQVRIGHEKFQGLKPDT